jgi:cobalt-zinc-cadmium efflux system protein
MVSAPGVCEVQDLHIWTITSGMDSLSAHAVLLPDCEVQTTLDGLRKILHERFGIDHITIQIDPAGQEKCRTSF